ncbi:5-hydroxytryptamine receptor 3A-like [Salvelinus fontinalis]|uniref:5-hydroxytryptamine receptor 3A-like n=1 Tax=Salvelinus fontinalis TaxID=8038 RepID=UPI002486AD44|nr:5-hydroxytryptamine receptor 3A-like [Salvelinus fontinalis]
MTPGNASNTSTAAQPSNTASANQPSNPASESQPSNTASANQPSNTTSANQPSNAASANQPSNTASANQPSNAASANQPSNTASANQPSNTASANQPSNAASANQPSNAASANQPSNAASANQPSNTASANQPSNTASANQPSNAAISSSSTTPSCTTRRCLASMLIAKEVLSQPQSPSCISNISVPLIVYETLSVDTKDLRFESHLQVMLSWEDPDLSWDTSVYHHNMVVLPVSKIWTPELHVTNGVQTTTKHSNKDLLVHSNGTVEHMVIMNTVVGCEVNLYNYPFASDFCPIAINVWALKGCGMFLNFGKVSKTSANRGDWLTENVKLDAKGGRDDRNYLWVSLKMRSENPFLSLVLPSILIIVSDVVSFALPLGGGERISFKVTLVLSFIMFLIILNDLLPGGGQCSPIIRECPVCNAPE